MNDGSLQNVAVARQIAREREQSLLRMTHLVGRGRGGGIRRWLGRGLVRTGTWLANDRPMQPNARQLIPSDR